MGDIQAGSKRLAGLNYLMQYEHWEVRDGIAREGQGLWEEDESRLNEMAEDIDKGSGEDVAPPTHRVGLKRQQQPGPVIRWERFLPVRTPMVLLVENDDSTRQLLCALLRNCSYEALLLPGGEQGSLPTDMVQFWPLLYLGLVRNTVGGGYCANRDSIGQSEMCHVTWEEVTATKNGLQALKILDDLNNHIDLVLTEVAMPCLSGLGLLCKIMCHKTYKNIPVIMMSSNNSMSTVFKCLSKGAVDFLVKPIRKNELRNLWQHVWRRCHSSSSSGNESGIQTQKSPKTERPDDSDNNTGSNDEDDNGCIDFSVKDGSDNASGTKTSEDKDKMVAGSNELPSLELSLKRPGSSEEGGSGTHDDHNILRHSNQSAFSRYNASVAAARAPTGYGESRSILNNKCSEPVKTRSTYDMTSNSNAASLKQGSNGSSNNNDMGSKTKNVFSKPPAFKDKTEATSAVKFFNSSSAFQPVQPRACATPQVMHEKVDVAAAALVGHARGTHRQVKVQHYHHHYHHYHHHDDRNHRNHQQPRDHNYVSLKNMAAPVLQGGSSNVFVGPLEANAANYSINGSNSGSNCRMNIEIDKGLAEIVDAGGGNESRCGEKQNCFRQRLAALNKFRQKRKERNFKKKVRYQSRKRLAEQRPRVRGQFVRQNK